MEEEARDAQMVERKREVQGRVRYPTCDSGHTQALSGVFGISLGIQVLGCHSEGSLSEWQTWLGGRG